MLKIDPHSKKFLSLGRRTLEPVSLFERYPVRELIANSADVFFADLGRALFLLGQDVPLNDAGRRADFMLCDPEGRLYVARLQHGRTAIDLIEALEDAGLVSDWKPDAILRMLDDERRELFQRAFLKVPLAKLNAEQGVLLLAEAYNLETLASAGWLRERYGVRIDCYQLRLAADSLTQIEYLSCQDLSKFIYRIYQRQLLGDLKGAPWPSALVPNAPVVADAPVVPDATVVPDISDSARAAQAEPTAEPEAAPKPKQAEPAPPPVEEPAAQAPEPEPVFEPVEAADPLEAEVNAALEIREDGSVDPEPVEDELFFTGELSPEDDPLADILAGEAAALRQEEEDSSGKDRRVRERSRDYQARRLRLDYFGRLLGARLVDFSSTGLGVEALSPLPVGAEIGISGEILSESGTVGIEGRAKVEHCRSTQEGVCRIGFSLDKAVISEIDDPETFDRR
ncbi:MAG: hypothetical protein KDC27_09830 [Acidobacteria bacterium]|nr:hypothetical protein [Acidobacteriota bacterium]